MTTAAQRRFDRRHPVDAVTRMVKDNGGRFVTYNGQTYVTFPSSTDVVLADAAPSTASSASWGTPKQSGQKKRFDRRHKRATARAFARLIRESLQREMERAVYEPTRHLMSPQQHEEIRSARLPSQEAVNRKVLAEAFARAGGRLNPGPGVSIEPTTMPRQVFKGYMVDRNMVLDDHVLPNSFVTMADLTG